MHKQGEQETLECFTKDEAPDKTIMTAQLFSSAASLYYAFSLGQGRGEVEWEAETRRVWWEAVAEARRQI